jgi:chaperonin GroES
MNTSGINPLGYNVLVKPEVVEKKTKGGLYMPDPVVEKEEYARMKGVLVAASPMAFTFGDWPADADHMKPRVGDRVLFARYNATEITGEDDEKYWLMKDESIAGVFSDG